MTTQAPTASQDLVAARELLDKLDAATHGTDTDSQTAAITAAAHSILVLAEQVAGVRLVMVEDALSRRGNGHAVPQGTDQPAPQGKDQPAPQRTDQPAPQRTDQPAPQGKGALKKRGWW